LQKEGWFDNQGWAFILGEGDDHQLQFDEDRKPFRRNAAGEMIEERMVVGATAENSAVETWKLAHEMWRQHGEKHGLSLSPERVDNLRKKASYYRSRFGLGEAGMGPDLEKDSVDPELWESYDANTQLFIYEHNLALTNFNHFLYSSEAESDNRIGQVRKLLFQAQQKRRRAEYEAAIDLYKEAYSRLVGDPAAGKPALLDEYPKFRSDTGIQEELYESQLTYLNMLYNQRGPTLRAVMAAEGLVGYGMAQTWLPQIGLRVDPGGLASAIVYQYSTRHRELPNPFTGPLSGTDSSGQPWITNLAIQSVRGRLGLLPPSGPPPGVAPPPGPGGAPLPAPGMP